MYVMGYIPDDGAKHLVEYENIEFHIEEISERRIQLVHIVLKQEETETEELEDDEE